MAEKVSDGLGSFDLAIKAKRETKVRRGELSPISEVERRQQAEGFQGYKELDCVRAASGVGRD